MIVTRVNNNTHLLPIGATAPTLPPSVRRKRWRWCTPSVLCFAISLFSTLCCDANFGWMATTAFQGTLSSRMAHTPRTFCPTKFASPRRRQAAYVLSHGQKQQHQQQQRTTATTPLFDTERTEAEMKLSPGQIGPDEEGSGNVTVLIQETTDVPDIPVPTENGGFTHTNASKAKISAANKGKTPWNKGKERSAEVRQKIALGVRAKNRERFLEKLEALGLTEEEYERQKKDERNRKAAERRARQTEKGGFRPTDETRQKISEILKAKWANGEMPRRRLDPSKVRSGFTHSPETRAKISETLRQRWASDDVYRESMMNKTAVVNSRIDAREKISATLKAKWEDPEFRERMMEKIRSRRASPKDRDPEYRRKISEAMIAKWKDDEYRNKTTASIRKRASDAAKVRPPKQPKQKRSHGINAESKVRLVQVVAVKKPREPRKPKPLDVDENGEPIVKTRVKRMKKVERTDVKMVEPLTSNRYTSRDDDPAVTKKVEPAKKAKEPDGSINRLRDERRDLYDLLYGDDEDDADTFQSPPASGISAMLDLQDADLDAFDPYGLENF